jgi:hypothetical protein
MPASESSSLVTMRARFLMVGGRGNSSEYTFTGLCFNRGGMKGRQQSILVN